MTAIHRHKNLSGKWTTQVDGDHTHPDLEARIAALEAPPVVTPPPVVIPPAVVATISHIVQTPTATGTTVEWDVAPNSQGQIDYGATTAYGSQTARETSYNYGHHRQDLPASAVHFRVRAAAPGQTTDTLSADQVIAAPPVVVPPPVITPVPPVTPPPGTAPADTVMFTGYSMASDIGGQVAAFINQQRQAGKVAGFDGACRWEARQVLSGSGIRIWLGPNAKFPRSVHDATSKTTKEQLQFFRADGLVVLGSNAYHFTGPATAADVSRRDDAYPGEEEYGWSIMGGSHILIQGVWFKGYWSDGIYVYRADDTAGSSTQTRDLTLRDIVLDQMGRNSLTINSVEGLLMERVTGTLARLHGLDYEPNRPDDLFKDATLKDCGFWKFDAGVTASGAGYAVAIGHKDTGGKATNVKIVNQRSDTGIPKGGTLYVVGPAGRHQDITVTGWTGSTGSGHVTGVNGWVQSGNSISLPASGNVG